MHAPQPNVQQIALENLVGFSKGPYSHIFKTNDLEPVKDLKTLIRDQRNSTSVKQALTILINLCDDISILESLSSDESLVQYISNSILDLSHPHADLFCMLIANLAKRDTINSIFKFKRSALNEKLTIVKSTDPNSTKTPLGFEDDEVKKIQQSRDSREANSAKFFGPPGQRAIIDCLLDCFVKGHDRSLNKYADYDYLAFFFSDLSRFKEGRTHFITPKLEQSEYSASRPVETGEEVYPITKLLVFTESPSKIRREGIATTVKNCLFDVQSHSILIFNASVNILPYILLPLAGPEDIPEDEMLELPDELQFLPPEKKREPESAILCIYVECLMLLSTTKEVREYLRDKSVYSIIRQLHMNVEDEEVQDVCERLVNVLKRDDHPDIEDPENVDKHADNQDDEDEDDKIVEIL